MFMRIKDYIKLDKKPYRIRDMLIIAGVFIVILFGAMYLVVNLNVDESNVKFNKRFRILSSGWEVTANGETFEAELPLWVNIKPRESVTLSRKLPYNLEDDYVLVTRNYHNIVRASVDGHKIYAFPTGAQSFNSTIITDDWNMIHLPDNKGNTIVRLEFVSSSSGYSGYINPIYYGEDNAILAELKSLYLLPYVLALTIIVLGFLLILVDSVYTKSYADKSHLILGFIFLAIGMWFADRSKMPVFVIGSNVKFFFAFSGLIIAPLLLTFYAGERFPKHSQLIVNSLTILDLAAMVFLFAIVGLKRIPIHSIVQYVYILAGISVLYIVYLLWYYSYGKGRQYLGRVALNSIKLEFASAIIVVVLSVLSIVRNAASTNNWDANQREWTGIGNMQMLAVIVYAFFHLIILLYQGYYGVLESEETQKKLHNSQLQLMMGQIQPHFMFNTLSSIRTLIKIDPDLAYEMTYNFSNYLRANVDNLTNLDGIKFAAEVKHIESYVGIEEVRFGDRLNVEFDIQESDFIVPPLSIQPLVENAIKHGVCQRPEGGTVWLRSYSEGDSYIIEVEDNGVGIPDNRLEYLFPKKASYMVSEHAVTTSSDKNDERENFTGNGSEVHESTGMKNIMMRLKEISNATLDVTTEVGKGTKIRVIFPRNKK